MFRLTNLPSLREHFFFPKYFFWKTITMFVPPLTLLGNHASRLPHPRETWLDPRKQFFYLPLKPSPPYHSIILISFRF